MVMGLGQVAVIGAGSWGTALVKLLSSNAQRVGWWVRGDRTIEHIRKYGHNPSYISAAQFEVERLAMSDDLHAVVKEADTLIVAVPSAFLKNTIEKLDRSAFDGKTLFSAVKGIVPETNQIVGEYLFDHWGVSKDNFGVICGPCHAEEVAMERLSYLTIASQNAAKAEAMGKALNGRFMKTTLSDDIYGTEYAAILKNVIAVCSGISVGLGYGDNFRAVLVSRAIQEIDRFHLQPQPRVRHHGGEGLQREGRSVGNEHGGRRLLRGEVRARDQRQAWR
jgi:glycerol-3-phosphate dehydrogenase (NAD(P)+)